MRQIKYRAKRACDNNWVYGYIYIESISGLKWAEIKTPTKDGEYNDYRVFPETIGEFTGLYDKNGKEIYEGDVVEMIEKYIDSDMFKIYICVVVYRKGCFELKMNDKSYVLLGFIDTSQIKIIDNIHDNNCKQTNK